MRENIGETGVVTEVLPETIMVKLKRTSACSGCGACKPWNDTEMLVEAVNKVGAKLNDRVRLDMESQVYMSALAVLYGIPFAGIIGGFAVGTLLFNHLGFVDIAPLAGFGLGIFMAFVCHKIIKAAEPKRKKEKRLRAAAVEIID